MSYDWEKIFKSKSDKELYIIYTGNSHLPKITSGYAKKELEKRNFDFKNIDTHKIAWKLNSLIEDEENYQLELSESKFKFISFKFYLFLLIGTLIVLYVLNESDDNAVDAYLGIIPYGFILITILVLINNYISKKQKRTRENRLIKISEIKNKLKKDMQLEKNSSILNDIERSKHKRQESNKMLIYLGIVLSIFIIIAIIYKVFVK